MNRCVETSSPERKQTSLRPQADSLRYSMNEFDFIRQLRERVRSREAATNLISGIGDDAAVIRQTAAHDSVISADLLIEGIDFHRASTLPRLLGHKALAVSLSDIAAMGARPLYSLLSIGLPDGIWDSNFKDELYEGYLALAEQYGLTLIGGDISRAEQIVIDSIVVGEVVGGAAVLRSNARPGDQIFVTGDLGGAAAGLKLLELGARLTQEAVRPLNGEHNSDDAAIDSLLLRQLRPDARVGWGVVLGEERLATAMIDISDGLSSDLAHLCDESGTGALIDAAAIPVDKNVIKLCGRRALDPLALALHGGEDFELLFTVAPENVARLPKRVDGVQVSRIGEVNGATGTLRLREQNREWDLEPEGFEHFGK